MLGDLLSEPLSDVMAPEVVAVPTRGIERWLTQQLSGRLGTSSGRTDGICANVDFPFPGTLVGTALSAASGIDRATDPWVPERSVWPLLQVVESSLDQDWLSDFATHLKKAAPEGEQRRFATVRHMADLYDRYSVHRPDMIRQWAAGSGGAWGSDARWQSRLWLELRGRIGTPSPAERLPGACALLREGADVPGIPERLSLFGLTSLPASYVDVLIALANIREVHLFLLHPSFALWDRICDGPKPDRGVKRSKDLTVSEALNPLLASWGRDSREMQLVLLGALEGDSEDVHNPMVSPPTNLLEHIQASVRANILPSGAPLSGGDDHRIVLDESDRSIQIHACHGRARQVEVLRHAILHLFEENPGLEPRDVLVMCPDIETYAPLIHAAFDSQHDVSDTGESPENPDLRVRLADRSIRQVNPLFAVVSRLLAMAGGRVTATEVLDLIGSPPVRRLFGFDDDDLETITKWVIKTGIRWGIDSAHRSPFSLEGLQANTWEFGIARLLVGVSMADEGERLFGDVLPLDDVGSGSIELAGRLAELIDRIATAVDELWRPKSVSGWAKSISSSVYSIARAAFGDEWQSAQLDQVLANLVEEATSDGITCQSELSIGDIRAVLEDRLRGRPTRANFRTGHLTVCTLVPMRSVPHRVVCLLGLDDGAFPRSPERDGDDLVLADPQIGDHDARSEDRQLILDALLAAKDNLVITYTGRDERSNLVRPPAVPVGELIDVIDQTAVLANGHKASSHLIIHHPLQPFDARNFIRGRLMGTTPWSFDRSNLDGALAAAGRNAMSVRKRPFLPEALAPIDDTTVELRVLESYMRSPVRAFLITRLNVNVESKSEDVDDALPVTLDALERWAIGDRIVNAMLSGSSLDACIMAEQARGSLPPGSLSDPILDDMTPSIEHLVSVAFAEGSPESLAVNLSLPSGYRVVGTVPGVRDDVVKNVTYSRMSPSQRLNSWLRLLCLTSAYPEKPFEAITYARGSDGDASTGPSVSIARIGVLGETASERQSVATNYLEQIVDLYLRSMREPPPLYCKTSAAWAQAASKGHDTEKAARKEWQSEYEREHEDQKAEHQIVFGGVAPFEDLLSAQFRDDELGPGWASDESTRLGRWARRLWDPILAVEQVKD